MKEEHAHTSQGAAPSSGGIIHKLFVAHPRSAGECYWRHLWFTLQTGVQMIFFALCLMLHGLLPFLCEKTAGNFIARLSATIEARKQKLIDCQNARNSSK